MSLTNVLGHHACSQTVAGVVGPLNDLVVVLELEDALYGPEDFFLGDGVVVLYVGEDGGGDVPAFALPNCSAADYLGAFFFPRLYKA